MSKLDDSIIRSNEIICRHLNQINGENRGVISQDILEVLSKFVNLIMLKFYSIDEDIDITPENIEKAKEFAFTNNELYDVYKFSEFLEVVATQYTLNEDGSERLMLKYYYYLLKIKKILYKHFKIAVLNNLNKFPLKVDKTLLEYHKKIASKIEQYETAYKGFGKAKYYILKTKPIYINEDIYYEVSFTSADGGDNKNKSNRIIAFTKLEIKDTYACKLNIINENITILNKTMPIMIITGWEVSIRDCEFQNFISLIKGEKIKVSYPEQTLINETLTKTRYSLTDLVLLNDVYYKKFVNSINNNVKTPIFTEYLSYCRDIIINKEPGHNVLRYLLYHLNNAVIKSQRFKVSNDKLSDLYLSNKCIQFDTLPFNRSLVNHNPPAGMLWTSISHVGIDDQTFARLIKGNIENKRILFTNIETLDDENIPVLIDSYNNKLWKGHRPRSELNLEFNNVYIKEYMIDTCNIIEKLKSLSKEGIENYTLDLECWLMISNYEIDSTEKLEILKKIFSESRVGVLYGSAGVGKSTLVNHISNYYDDKDKLYLAQTNSAVKNLEQKVNSKNSKFSTIASFTSKVFSSKEFELLVIDECSTVSNADMVKILNTCKFKSLLLVGDSYQIDSIRFGNWFDLARHFLPSSSVYELKHPYRTTDKHLLEIWDKVRYMSDDVKEIIQRESVSLCVGDSLFTSTSDNEVILCLNYDGLYGINNINRFLQQTNPSKAITWNIQQYKIGDPVIFLENTRFSNIIHNNMKGIIRDIKVFKSNDETEYIQFDIEIPIYLDEDDVDFTSLSLVSNPTFSSSIIRFLVTKNEKPDEDDEFYSSSVVPFQVAYAISIHKAQGLEFDSVKVVITDEVEELVTHDIFYTAITRARKNLKIYWTPETEEKVLKRIKPRDFSKDVEILKNYID